MRRNLMLIPFHDWRKCVREGFRTRDAHLIEAFTRTGDFENVLVVSRPTTALELALHRQPRDPGRDLVLRGPRWHVIRDSRGCYVFEYFDSGIAGQVLEGKSWFFKAYASAAMARSLFEAVEQLGMGEMVTLDMNIRSAGLATQLAARGIPLAFDAWDNWLRFPLGREERLRVKDGYAAFTHLAPLWFTNSVSNREVFEREFAVRSCIVVPNGVDSSRFRGPFDTPVEFERIRRPRAFFGGKITHLFDVDLFNEVTSRLQRIQFVIAGPIINGSVWKRIKRPRNVHYLRDVHYSDYPAYVAASDVCIAPYTQDERSHGGDSIKLYEYIAARRPTVSTGGNGAHGLSDFIWIANSSEEFAEAIVKGIESGVGCGEMEESRFSWDERARTMAGHMIATFGGKVATSGALNSSIGETVTGRHG